MRVIEAVKFKRIEHQRCGEGGDFVLRIRHEFGAIAVGGDLVIAQTRVGHDAPCDDIDLFVALYG